MANKSRGNITKGLEVVSYVAGTGEEVKHQWAREKVRYGFLGGWRAFGMVEMKKVLNMGLSNAELRVALWLPMISKVGNIVIVTGKMAQDELGIERHYFSTILSKLVKLDIIKRGAARGTFEINPQFAWNGSAAAHRAAREKWYQEAIAIMPKWDSWAG